MKTALIYATCQGRMIYDVLYASRQFSEQYIIVDHIHNYELIRTQRSFLTYSDYFVKLKNADLFIYQPLAETYGENATDTLKTHMKPGSQAISIPYLWNFSFWPMVVTSAPNISDNFRLVDTELIKNSSIIKKLLVDGWTESDILSAYDHGQIDFNYAERFRRNQNILRIKERGTDVKAVDFIEQNYKTKKLFNDVSHPSYELILHMGNQILNKLGFDPVETLDMDRCYMPTMRTPYDHSGKNAFNFEFPIDDNASEYFHNVIKKVVSQNQHIII